MHTFRLRRQQFKCAERGRCQGRGEGHRIDESRRMPPQDRHECRASGDVATRGGQRLGQSPHPDIDVARIDIRRLETASPGSADATKGMRFVHHQPGPETPLQRNKRGQRGNVPIHGEKPLGHDQRMAILRAVLFQQGFEGGHVVVREGPPRRARQLHSDLDRVVAE